MQKEGLSFDDVTYNTLMDGLCKVGNLKEAIELFKQMKYSSHLPDMITYTTLMNGL